MTTLSPINGEDIQRVLRGDKPVGGNEDELVIAHMRHGEILARLIGGELRKHNQVVVGCALVWLALDWLRRVRPKHRAKAFADWITMVLSSMRKNEARERRERRKRSRR